MQEGFNSQDRFFASTRWFMKLYMFLSRDTLQRKEKDSILPALGPLHENYGIIMTFYGNLLTP